MQEKKSKRLKVPAAVAAEPVSEGPAVLSRHRPWLSGLLTRLTGNAALAQDLVQETFVKAIAARGPREPEKMRAWLAAIALNAARDSARKMSIHREVTPADMVEVVDETPAPDEALLNTEMKSCIVEFVDRLPNTQRQVVALHDLLGLTHADVADRLAITEANSRVLLHRGRSNLRELLEEGCILEFDSDPVPCERKPTAGE